MNLTRALNEALPEMPARTIAERYPRPDPGLKFREHLEEGKPVIRVYVPSSNSMYRFPPGNWKLAQLFDGKRSFEEIAELYSQNCGIAYDEEEIRDFAAELEAAEFWYKTPSEKNILEIHQATDQRRKKVQQRSRWTDITDVTFPAFNPDRLLTKLYQSTKFIYTTWFTTLTLIAFAFALGITVAHWSEIGRDTKEFYNFSSKTWGDILVLYSILFGVVIIHEFAHAYVSKHFGNRVTAMGFALIYLTPALYTDTTEAEAMSSRYERVIVTVAGVWSELMVCAIATFVWWGSPPDTLLHNGAYFLMMLTGLVSVLVNWNPLIKLDGYHMMCDIIGIAGLKENSTLYASSWVKKHIWKLPVEVPYVPPHRRVGYVLYALASGAYCYMAMYFVAGFAGNIVRNFSPEWGFVPEIAVALMIFRSRIGSLVKFMRFLYLDKKDRIRTWFPTQIKVLAAMGLALFLILPIWRDSAAGSFELEPLRKSIVRARVPGVVTSVFVHEGQEVLAGSPLVALEDRELEAEYQSARARLLTASDRTRYASMHYGEYGPMTKEQESLASRVSELGQMNSEMNVNSAIPGTVLTPRVQDLLGSRVKAGSELLEVGDLSVLLARIYISEYYISQVSDKALANLQVQGIPKKWQGQIVSIAPKPTEMESGISGKTALAGVKPPHFFLVDIAVANPNLALRPGMTGYARIYGRRRSTIAIAWRVISHFWRRKLW